MGDRPVNLDLRIKERLIESPVTSIAGLIALVVGNIDSIPPEAVEYVTQVFQGGDHKGALLNILAVYLIWKLDKRSK